jgi:hypothetical protein
VAAPSVVITVPEGEESLCCDFHNSGPIQDHVADEGDGFDPKTLPDPLAPERPSGDSGRGVYLSRAFMDEYHVRSRDAGGAEVTLIKYLAWLYDLLKPHVAQVIVCDPRKNALLKTGNAYRSPS